MPFDATIFSAVFAYVTLLALLRIAHKRAVAQATPFDFVLALILGDLVDDVLWGEVGAATFLAAVAGLMLCRTAVAVAGCRSPRWHELVASTPRVLMRRAKVDRRALQAECVSEAELAELLRLGGVPRERWWSVDVVRLEPSGKASVIRTRPAA